MINLFQKKTVMTIAVIGVLAFLAAIPEVAANTPNITAGLEKVSADDLAKKILNIAIGCAALAGVIAAVMLTYLGFKLKTGSEKDRAETKEHVVWVFLGLALAGFAAVIAGFAAFMIKGD
jgi:hypothetical protein